MAAKKRNRALPELNAQQMRKLVESVASAATNSETATRLGISDIDVQIIRQKLEIQTTEAAKKLVKQYRADDEKAEISRASKRNDNKKANKEAQARLDKINEVVPETEEAEVLIKRGNEIKQEDKARQKKFEETIPKSQDLLAPYRSPSKYFIGASMEKPKSIKDGEWHLPAEVTTEEFRFMLLSKGVSFVCDNFGIKKQDLQREVGRLNIKIDFDLLPR